MMIWNTISREEKHRRRKEWHTIFAWAPHKISTDEHGRNTWAWLTTIGRIGTHIPVGPHGSLIWEYSYCSKEEALLNKISSKPAPTPLMLSPTLMEGVYRPKPPAPTAPPSRKGI